MARIFTIDGLGAGPPAPPAAPARALGLMRWAAWQGLQDATTDLEAKVAKQLFWVKIGVGVAATAATLALVVSLATAASAGGQKPPRRR